MIPLIGVILMVIATVALGLYATKKAHTASDFFVAGRTVGVLMNASAISGEYLSAASFMGIAGLIMKSGYDALWYPVGYAAGYLFLLLFIAGPLRRFGAYTIPDFAEGRFNSPAFRKIAVIFVLFIGFFYTMPQMKGAGVTMGAILGWPYWVGIVIVGSVITFNVALGGMKGITLVQAFQYWAKLFAICIPLFVLAAFLGGPTPAKGAASDLSIASTTAIKMKGKEAAPANVLALSTSGPTVISFAEACDVKMSASRKSEPGEDKVKLPAQILEQSRTKDFAIAPSEAAGAWGTMHLPAGASFEFAPVPVTQGGAPVMKDGKPVLSGVKLEFVTPSTLHLAGTTKSAVAPNAPAGAKWLNPYGPTSSKWGYPVLYTFSLIIALVCGTAGLPHILVRFYTNPNGKAARRTTFWVMILLGAFYVFTPVWGTLGRSIMPQLYANNSTDTVLIKLPTMIEGTLGQILGAVTAAGAFAAFMSTFSGLLVSMSGAFAHDIYGKIIRPNASQDSQKKAFQVAAVGVGVISMVLGYFVETFDIATMVGWAFAIGAASYFPLLLLGAWWRGLTAVGAATGMLLGGLLSLFAIVANMLLDKKVLAWDLPPLVRSLMEQPAIWGVPLAIVTMVLVSKATSASLPKDVTLKMLRLHAPEGMGISENYVD